MQEFFTHAAAILIICAATAAIIAFSIYKGDFAPKRELYYPQDELELRRRENETMLRHERRAAHAAAMKRPNREIARTET
jgi:hypothetical protein